MTLRSEGVDVHHERAPVGAALQVRADDRPQPRPHRFALVLIMYSILSGFVALVMGAVISLAAPAPQRLPWWAGATGVIAIAAGVAYHSRLLKSSRFVCRRWLHWFANFSTSSKSHVR